MTTLPTGGVAITCPAEEFIGLLLFHRLAAGRREAIEFIAERDCRHLGTAIAIVDVDEIPTDRTHRNAWRRSANGGPIWICETAAQAIDEQRMWDAYERT
ncbi:hypothetical protein [Hyphomicrobium sp. ghe19]|uniref:hypothetical protein n=1 Tax=Hyphomicrobium sp. ghe19 TaxID=2682968 RepID=UPI0030CDDCE6